ncbi:hypothetical protein GCM10017786_51790 [Amycolatopsis deserti]|uniref:Uncharacterized protein n=1 Tax=Amycolatopsis deserti TaxID=185696 RepID=A0ABQ3J901_9PSEU|nr:hypothetical protein GCM10017786_51790 [Amycolatopsis deserti]
MQLFCGEACTSAGSPSAATAVPGNTTIAVAATKTARDFFIEILPLSRTVTEGIGTYAE